MKRCTCLMVALLAGAIASSTARAQVIVDEDFEAYPTFGVDGGAAFKAVWMETNGGGTAAAPAGDLNSGIITDDAVTFPGIDGKAVDHIGATASIPGMVNQWDDDNNLATIPFNIVPSATKNVKLTSSIFVGNSGNERMTVGLRGRDPSAANLIEMGVYNANTCDANVSGCNATLATIPPETPGFYPSLGFGYRLRLFSGNAPLEFEPNWQYFQLPAGMDRTTDADELVTIGDVPQGWHTYTAEVSLTTVTLSLDLYGDGVINTRDETGTVIATEDPGPDATVSWPLVTNLAAGYDSLRIGGPSGVSSPGSGPMGFDNILLELVDVAAPENDADFNEDGTIDAADYAPWRKFNPLAGGATQTTGDANGDGDNDDADYAEWVTTFGQASPGGGGSGAVPEPTGVVMLIVGLAALAMRRRG